MKKNDNGKRLLVGGIIVSATLVIFALVGFFLADANVFKVNPFKLMFIILTLGVGLVFTVYAIATKGGYELAVGGIFLTIGVILILIGAVKWYGIILIALAMLALLFFGLLLLKSDKLIVERADEKEDYKPFKSYSEQLKEKEANKAETEEKTEE